MTRSQQLQGAKGAPKVDWRDMGRDEHFVQFYENDDFLLDSLASYLGEGLRAGEIAIVITTPAHRGGLEKRLQEGGVDLKAAGKERQYIVLDAFATLPMFMVNGKPDNKLFQQAVGSVVADATRCGARVRAFGEMVALLWADGHTDGAVQLEKLWNEMGRTYSFSLFCAYPISGFGGAPDRERFVGVCQQHSSVIPVESYAAQPDADERLRIIALLQQQANALQVEIEDRKRVEAELLRSKHELTSVLEKACVGLHWAGPDGILQWANAAELALLGYSKEEYIGHHVAEFHVDREVIEDIIARLKRGEEIRQREGRLRCKDGSVKQVLIDSTVLWENGRFVHTQSFTRDITEQKRDEAASRHMAALVEHSDDAIVSKDLNGIITTWNEGARRVFGYSAEEIIGRPVTDLMPPDRRYEEPIILERVRRGEPVEHCETVRQRKDGTLIDVSLTISPIKDAKGKVIGVSKIARDISERKRVERDLQMAREQLVKANEDLEKRVEERTLSLKNAVAQMEEFSYTVSHDLRTPLRGMAIHSTALLEDYPKSLPPEGVHHLRRIADNAALLDKMILDVLTFSRVAREELRLERVSLNSLVGGLAEQLRFGPRRPVIQIDPLLDVMGHRPALNQAISNLLGNAVKFVDASAVPKVRVWTESRGAMVRVWVEDNGIGIPPDYQHRLFGMFERVHPQLGYEGNGVGLAIVRKAAGRMGGKAGVESDGANGSRFWIEIPAAA